MLKIDSSSPLQRQTIVVVIPVYNEAKNIPLLYQRLSMVAVGEPSYRWQFVWVNDGSSDASWDVLTQLAKSDIRVSAIDLSRNFGKEIALTAGVHSATDADAVICIDADLQHPPELIPQLLISWRQGAEVVATVRSSIERQPLMRKIGSHAYYWLMSKISGLDMRSQTTDFRLFDRKVVLAFCRATERERMFRGIMDWLGFRKVYIEFNAAARESGEAGYSYGKLWQLAVGSITSFSLMPLKLTGYLGLLITILSGVGLAWMLGVRSFMDKAVFSPLAIIVVANTFLIGIVLSAIGLVALYIGHIHTEVINRPLYVVREQLGRKLEV